MRSSNISYAGKKVSVGIDVHRKTFVVCAYSCGERISICTMPACGEALLSYLRHHFKDAELRTCYEAGYSGYWLHRYLLQNDVSNIVIHAAGMEVESGNRRKTDKRDARKLAEQLDSGRLRGIYVPTQEEESGRMLTRTREQLKRSRSRVVNQIRMKFHLFNLLPQDYDRVLRLVDAKKIAQQALSIELRVALESLISLWEHLNSLLKKLMSILREQAKNDPFERVYRSAPGYGLLSSRILSNELGDMSRFPNERALFSYTGLTPQEYSSGDSVRRGHISKQGNPQLRFILIEAAWRAVKIDKSLGTKFMKLSARAGKKRAIVAIARILLGRVRAAFRKNELYQMPALAA